nr:unnamed protein product [Digitaria exilis]
MSLRQLLAQARQQCLPSPRLPQLPGFLLLCLSTWAGSAAPKFASLHFHIDVVDSDLWPASFGFSLEAARGNEYLDDLQRHDDEVRDFDDEIDDMRHRKKLFYKLDRGSKEYEENNVTLRRSRNRDKANAKNPKECKKVDPVKSVSSNAPKLKAKHAAREEDMVEVKRERVPTFNQITDPYHHPFCLDIHVTKGSVRACFVHRVTSRVVAVAHSISKDMKFDLGSRKGKGMKACAARQKFGSKEYTGRPNLRSAPHRRRARSTHPAGEPLLRLPCRADSFQRPRAILPPNLLPFHAAMALATLRANLAAGRFGRVVELTSGGASTAAAAHRVLHLLLRTVPLPHPPHLVSFARWSRAHFRAPLPLRLHAFLLARLASRRGAQYPLLRSEIHALVAARLHSPASILRALSGSSPPAPLIADMLVAALAKDSQPLAAFEAFLLASADYPRHRPSVFSVNALLAALVRADRIDLAEKAFRVALRQRVSPDLLTFNMAISGLCKIGQLRKAGDVAKDIRVWGLAPSVVTYNTLINGHLKSSQAGKMYHVDMLLKEMVEAAALERWRRRWR